MRLPHTLVDRKGREGEERGTKRRRGREGEERGTKRGRERELTMIMQRMHASVFCFGAMELGSASPPHPC